MSRRAPPAGESKKLNAFANALRDALGLDPLPQYTNAREEQRQHHRNGFMVTYLDPGGGNLGDGNRRC